MNAVNCDVDAERAVIGAILENRDAIVAIDSLLRPEDFYIEAHATIYGAAQACYRKRIPPDLTTVQSELQRTGRLEAVGGLSGLLSFIGGAVLAYHIEYYARPVQRTAILRRLSAAAGEIAKLAAKGAADDALTTVADAQSILNSVAMTGADGMATSEVVSNELFAYWSDEGDDSAMVKTGLFDYDDAYGGLGRATLSILAARPRVGKSSLADQLAAHIGLNSGVVALFNLEMKHRETQARMVANIAGVNVSDVMRPGNFRHLDQASREAAMEALGRLSECKIYHKDDKHQTIATIRTEALKLAHQHGQLDLVVVDYLQLIAPMFARREGNREREVAEISRGLKVLADEVNAPVIALSQLNREIEKRANGMPLLSDLRESGAVEQDADNVIFIHRPGINNHDEQDDASATEAMLIISKARNGPPGLKINLRFDGATGRWQNIAKYVSPEGY